jgi:polysaccharide pyruvyl transferase WcaK-like protein
MARYRSYRDRYSKDFMTGIGIDTRDDPLFPDLAFTLPSPERVAQEKANGHPLTVGVGIMSYYGWRGEVKTGAAVHEKYIAEIARFVRWLLDSGYHIRLLTGDVGDKPAVDKVMTLATSDHPQSFRDRVIAEDARSLSDIMRQIAETDILIASRFHNLVCALKLGLPAISISYAKKNDELLREVGLGEFRQNIEELDTGLLIRQFTKLLGERERYIKTVAAAAAEYRMDLQRQEALLLSKIL